MATNFDDSPPTVDNFARPVGGTDTLDSPDQATLVNNHSDAIEEIESKFLTESYNAPTAYGNGLTTFTATWVAVWTDWGPSGFVKYKANVTANWAGTGYLTVDLPTGWTASYDSVLHGMVKPMPETYGLRYPIWGEVAAGSTVVKLFAHDSASNKYTVPMDGVNAPLALTGDGTTGNQDLIVFSGMVAKVP